MALSDKQYAELTDVRVHEPGRIEQVLVARRRRSSLTTDGMMFLVAADHTARGMLGVGHDHLAMIDRRSMLERVLLAFENPRVDGLLASPEIMEDLALLGALDDRIAIGTMNRGGLAGASWTLDDRFTAYGAEHIAKANLDGGKMLLRIDGSDAFTAPTLEACARAIQELADRKLMAMVEPIPYTKDADGSAVWDHDAEHLLAAVGVSAALAATSAHTWLKIQATADIERVARVTTQPLLLLGGAPGPDPKATFALWERALAQPTVRGLVVGRSLLYPADGDVAGAVGIVADMVTAAAKARR
jgi:hypothetical protein